MQAYHILYQSMMKLEGKVAIITGGASGIGEATARLFALQGALAVVIADLQRSKGQQVAQSIGSDRCTFIACDVTDEHQVISLVESTVRMFGHLDIMFSNAGILSGCETDQNILDFDLEASERLFAVNVRGTTACVKHAARAMVKGDTKGSIVCTTSVSATIGVKKFIDYVMSKHAVLGLMRCASKDLGEYGIRVNCVSPAAVATPLMVDRMKMSSDEIDQRFGEMCSLKGRVLTSEDVANAVSFLASEDSAFVTGHNLVVDGAFHPTTAV